VFDGMIEGDKKTTLDPDLRRHQRDRRRLVLCAVQDRAGSFGQAGSWRAALTRRRDTAAGKKFGVNFAAALVAGGMSRREVSDSLVGFQALASAGIYRCC